MLSTAFQFRTGMKYHVVAPARPKFFLFRYENFPLIFLVEIRRGRTDIFASKSAPKTV